MDDLIKKLAFLGQVKKQDGQILLVIILATVVALTVGLSAISRTITNTRLSTEEANSQKALSAAEAGIEQLLSDPLTALIEKDLSNNATFTANAVEVSVTPFHLNDGNKILKDDGADVWLTDQPDFSTTPWDGQLNIYWTTGNNDCNSAAIEVAVIEGIRSDPSMRRVTADPCALSAGRDNNFSAPNTPNTVITDLNGIAKTYKYQISIPITNGFIARIIPLYEDTQIAIDTTAPSDPLPVQGYVIESVGTSGDTIRKLRVYQANPRLPIEFFPYNVFLP